MRTQFEGTDFSSSWPLSSAPRLTSEPGHAGAVEVGDQVDAGGAVRARAGPALVPVGLAERSREAVLAVAVVARPSMSGVTRHVRKNGTGKKLIIKSQWQGFVFWFRCFRHL